MTNDASQNDRPKEDKGPSLGSLREATRALYVDLARFRVAPGATDSELVPVSEAMDDAEKTLRALDKIVRARHAAAKAGGADDNGGAS